jgi:hypothetical protein
VSWVVSLPSARRDAAAQSLRIWSAMQWSRRAQLLAAQARGQDELTEALAGTRASHEGTWKRASTVLLRLAKLAAFHVQVYSRSGAAALTPSGRSRLRFWRRRPD